MFINDSAGIPPLPTAKLSPSSILKTMDQRLDDLHAAWMADRICDDTYVIATGAVKAWANSQGIALVMFDKLFRR